MSAGPTPLRANDGPDTAPLLIQGARRFEVLSAVMVVMFFSSMASTMVSTALPNIISDLHGLDLYAWVFTAFMLASAVVVPIYGKLSDVLGRKPLYVVAIGLFTVGNVLGGLAQNMEMLIAARAIAGMGGGGMQALSQITIGDIFTPQERGRWMGLLVSSFSLAAIVGPTIGGWMTDSWGWRWIFWYNIPISLIPLALLVYVLPTIRRPGRVKIDYLGTLTLVTGLVPVLMAVTWIGEGYSVSSSRVSVAFISGLCILGLFVWQEFRAEEPIVSPAFFRNRIFTVCLAASFCVALGMYGTIMFVPLFVQGVVGTSAQDSGVVLAPMMGGFLVGSVVSGQLLSRWGRYRIQALVGLSIATVGMVLFSFMGVHSGNLVVMRNMVIVGIGIGSTMPLFSIAIQNAFPHSVLGVVTSSRTFFTSLGGSMGVPILGAILNHGFTSRFQRELSPQVAHLLAGKGGQKLSPAALTSAEAQARIHVEFARFGPSGEQLYSRFIFAVRDSLAVTMQSMFHLVLGFIVAGLIISFFLKEIPLRRFRHETEYAATDEAATLVAAPEPIIDRSAGG